MATNRFKPIMVSFNEEAYNNAQEQAKAKLELLDKASVWVHNNLDIDKNVNLKRLHLNMVEYFKDAILVVFKDVNQLGLSASKLIEAKEIPIKELWDIQEEYNKNKLEVTFEKNVPKVEVQRKDFEVWTTSERQNKRLLAGNKFISNIAGLQEYVHIYPKDIMQGTSGFVRYDIRNHKYYVNPEFVFSN